MTLPLLLFVSAARRVSLATLGLMQCVSPSIQFLLSVFVYQEPFTAGLRAADQRRSPASDTSVSAGICRDAG